MIPGTVLLSAVLLLQAQEPSLDSLIRQLHSDDLEERERATAGLRKLGARAMVPLKEVASGANVDAAARARTLLHLIRIDRLCKLVVLKVDNPFSPFGRADYFQIAPDGKTAVGCDLEGVFVWTVPEGRLVRTWKGHAGHVAPAFNKEGTRLLTFTKGYVLNLWEYPAGKLIKRWETLGRRKFRQGPIRFHPDGRRVFSVFEGPNLKPEFAAWDLESGEIVRTYGTCDGFMRAGAVSPDGTRVAVSGRDGFTSLWDVESGRRLWGSVSGNMINCFEFLPDGASVILAGEDGRIEKRSTATGAVESVFTTDESRVLFTSLNPEGTLLATSGDHAPVLIFDTRTGREVSEGLKAGYPARFAGASTVLTPFASVAALTGDVQHYPRRVMPYSSCIDDTRTRMAIGTIHSSRIAVAELEGKGAWSATSPILPSRLYLGAGGTRVLVWSDSEGGQLAGFPVGSATKPDWQAKKYISGCDSTRGLFFELTNEGMKTFDMATGASKEVIKGTVDGPIRFSPGSPLAFGLRNNVALLLDPRTLTVIREQPDVRNIDVLDADASGSLLLEGWTLLDPSTGKVVGTISADLSGFSSESKVARTFFGKDGESILALTANGMVITLVPGE
jgi:WD40 repeat protein